MDKKRTIKGVLHKEMREAIANDAINMYVRDVLRPNNFLIDNYSNLSRDEILELKGRVIEILSENYKSIEIFDTIFMDKKRTMRSGIKKEIVEAIVYEAINMYVRNVLKPNNFLTDTYFDFPDDEFIKQRGRILQILTKNYQSIEIFDTDFFEYENCDNF